jgi:hypothetical protein
VSGYLARLVDRAVGPPAAAVSPRVGPVFPVRPPGHGGDPAVVTVGSDNVQVSRPPGPALGRGRAARAGEPPSPVPRGSEDAAPPAARATRVPALWSSAQGDRPAGPAPSVVSAQVREPVGRGAVPAVPAVLNEVVARTSDVRVEPGPAMPREAPSAQETPAPSPVVARPRPAGPELRLPPGGVGAGASREGPPRIEVRIGRVEVRRPAPPEPVEWPAPAPAAVERAAGGFGELAATRRYVDRRWS